MTYPEAIAAVRNKSASTIANLIASYATIGAVCESSRWLAQGLEKATRGSSFPVVELGAGYGSVTRVLPASTVSIERDLRRFEYLKAAFPDRQIMDTCATVFLASLQHPTVIVSSIPSVNNPEFGRIRASVAQGHKVGTVVALITYTYFPHDPFAGIFPNSKMVRMELRNVPPAFIWRYSQ
jgi:phospholipid N-methyltransferase